MTFFKALFRWLAALFGSKEREYKVVVAPELPEACQQDALYLIGEDGSYWFAALRCPCGCGTDIHLNLLSSTRPVWRVHLEDEGVSLSPSVWRTSGCRSHFFVRDGRIVWAPTTEGRGWNEHPHA